MMRKSFTLFNKNVFKFASLIIGSSALYKCYEIGNKHKYLGYNKQQQYQNIFHNKLATCSGPNSNTSPSTSSSPSKLYQFFKSTTTPTVFIFHSKARPFHQGFVNTTFKLFQNLGIHVYTIDNYTDIQQKQFCQMIPDIKYLTYSSYMPVVLFKNGEHVIQLDPYKLLDVKNDDYFKTQYSRHFVAEKFNSVGELIALLKQFNKKLQDSVCVMYQKKQSEQSEDKRTPAEKIRQSNPLAWNAMSSYNKAMLITHNEQLAEELKLEQGYFYIYYKPSYINGYEDFLYSKSDTNVEAFQAVEGMCRDRFKFNEEFKFKHPKKYSRFVRKTKDGKKMYRLVTPQMVKEVIDRGDQAFERTYNTRFLMETVWDEEHIKTSTFKPIVLVYIKDDLAEFLLPKLNTLMEKFAGQFEFYFTSQQEKAEKYFPVEDLLGIPYLMIIDNTKKVLVKGNQHMMQKYIPAGSKIDFNSQYDFKTGEVVPKKKSQQEQKSDPKPLNYLKSIPSAIIQNPLLTDSVNYTTQIFKIQSFDNEVESFLKKYYSGELYNDILAPFSKPVSEVKDVNTKILYNELRSKKNTANQCIIQAYAPSCASCQFNGKVFNGFSRKLKKHGMLKDLPLYRMDSRNVSPIFGRFPYTPMYFYVQYEKIDSDDGGKNTDIIIKRVDKISPIVKFNKFKQQLLQKANLPRDFDEKIKLSPQQQFQSYFMQKDLEQNYDADFDYNKGKKLEDQYRAAEEEKKKKKEE